MGARSGLGAPDSPWSIATGKNIFEFLAFLEGIHAGPETVMAIGHKLAFGNEAAKRIFDQFFAVAHVIENLLSENEEAAVHTEPGLANMLDTLDVATIVGLD